MEIGVTIQGVQSKEVTGFGEEYCFTVLPESTNMVPMKVYEADESSADGIRWRQEYPKYKKANIDKHGILETGDLAYLFVHQTHPAIALLRANKDLLGSDIDAQQKIDNEWYKVSVYTPCTVRTSGNPTRPLTHSALTGPEGDLYRLLQHPQDQGPFQGLDRRSQRLLHGD
jgi:hypothetical protein